MQRIGVFVCHCGSNIAATVDIKKVVEMALKEQGVVHAEDYQYMCSEAGQAKIQEAIREKRLSGVVVCSCSPRMHETTFRNAAKRAGLNPYMVEIANIREHCSWIHKDMEEATKKAVILARAAIAKVNLNAPLQPGESRVTKRALIIGGGIAGIQTALDIADAGYEVDIVEKTPIIIKSIRITIITIALLFLPFLGCFLCLNEYVCSLFLCSFVVSFCSVFVLFSTRSCFVSFTSSLIFLFSSFGFSSETLFSKISALISSSICFDTFHQNLSLFVLSYHKMSIFTI